MCFSRFLWIRFHYPHRIISHNVSILILTRKMKKWSYHYLLDLPRLWSCLFCGCEREKQTTLCKLGWGSVPPLMVHPNAPVSFIPCKSLNRHSHFGSFCSRVVLMIFFSISGCWVSVSLGLFPLQTCLFNIFSSSICPPKSAFINHC